MGIENSVSSSISTLSPVISSAPSLGGEFRPSFSFADTIPLTPPTEISAGGSFNPNFSLISSSQYEKPLGLPVASLDAGPAPIFGKISDEFDSGTAPHFSITRDFAIFEEGLVGINLDPDLPELEVPQVFYDAFMAEQQTEETPANIEVIPEATVLPHSEIAQATVTYESLKVAGITEVEAVTLTKNALIMAGIKPEIVEQTMNQMKIGPKTIIKVEEEVEDEKPVAADKEEKKKVELKFVLDEKANAERLNALKGAIDKASVQIINGEEMVNSIDVGANMPTETEKKSVKSEILPLFTLEELLGVELGDGSYRPFVNSLSSLGVRSKQQMFESGEKINQALPPVRLAADGKTVKDTDVKRVFEYKPDPIRPLRGISTLRNPGQLMKFQKQL